MRTVVSPLRIGTEWLEKNVSLDRVLTAECGGKLVIWNTTHATGWNDMSRFDFVARISDRWQGYEWPERIKAILYSPNQMFVSQGAIWGCHKTMAARHNLATNELIATPCAFVYCRLVHVWDDFAWILRKHSTVIDGCVCVKDEIALERSIVTGLPQPPTDIAYFESLKMFLAMCQLDTKTPSVYRIAETA